MVTLAIATFVGALALPALGIVGGGFLPEMDESEFKINIETPPGSNLDYTRLKAQEVARRRRAQPRSPTPTPRSAGRARRWTRASCT